MILAGIGGSVAPGLPSVWCGCPLKGLKDGLRKAVVFLGLSLNRSPFQLFCYVGGQERGY